jgi:hypothetical protein
MGSTPDQPKLADRETALRAYTKARQALEAADKATREKGGEVAAEGKAAGAQAEKALEGAQERLEQARVDAAKALEEARKRLQAAGRELSKIEITPQLQAAMDRVLEPADEQRRRTRSERADAARAALKKEHGAALDKPGAHEQLERHAWRVARLNRLIELADAAGQKEAGDRARALLAKEEAANIGALRALAGGKGDAPGAMAKKEGASKEGVPEAAAPGAAALAPTKPHGADKKAGAQ